MTRTRARAGPERSQHTGSLPHDASKLLSDRRRQVLYERVLHEKNRIELSARQEVDG